MADFEKRIMLLVGFLYLTGLIILITGSTFMETGVVDRFENNGSLVVVELDDKSILVVPLEQFKGEIHVNDVVKKDADGLWKKDEDETIKRFNYIKELMDSLWEKGGDD